MIPKFPTNTDKPKFSDSISNHLKSYLNYEEAANPLQLFHITAELKRFAYKLRYYNKLIEH